MKHTVKRLLIVGATLDRPAKIKGQKTCRTVRHGTNDGKHTHQTETSDQLACGKTGAIFNVNKQNDTTTIILSQETLTKAGNLKNIEELTTYRSCVPEKIRKRPRDADPPNTQSLSSILVCEMEHPQLDVL